MAHSRIMKASQSSINKIESLKRKLSNCNASVYFNRKCVRQTLTPVYAKIKIPNTSPACRHTQQRVTNLRLKDEIKFLHYKKQKLNALLYHSQLALANTWNNLRHHMLHMTEDRLQRRRRNKNSCEYQEKMEIYSSDQ